PFGLCCQLRVRNRDFAAGADERPTVCPGTGTVQIPALIRDEPSASGSRVALTRAAPSAGASPDASPPSSAGHHCVVCASCFEVCHSILTVFFASTQVARTATRFVRIRATDQTAVVDARFASIERWNLRTGVRASRRDTHLTFQTLVRPLQSAQDPGR
ncbi:MAG: hypothetical protein BJ554DRAFT_434, partial [Olpidium bornovanus]